MRLLEVATRSEAGSAQPGVGKDKASTRRLTDAGLSVVAATVRRVEVEGVELPVPSSAHLERYCDHEFKSWRTKVKMCPHEHFANWDVCLKEDAPLIDLRRLEGTMLGVPECQFYFDAKRRKNERSEKMP